MATVTLRPNSVVSNTGWVTGGSGLPAEIADGSDAGFTRSTTESGTGYYATCGLSTFAWMLPTQINSVTFFIRWRGYNNNEYTAGIWLWSQNGASQRVEATHYWTNADYGVTLQNQSGATTTSPNGAAWTTTLIDSLEVVFWGGGGTAGLPVYCDIFDIWAVVDYTVLFNIPPTAVLTGPAGLTTTLPTIAWTFNDPEGSAQERYWVKVFRRPAAGWGSLDPETNTVDRHWSSGSVVSAATSVVVGTALKRGVDYRAYIKVGEVNYGGRFGFWFPGLDFKADGSGWGGIKQ